MPGKAYNIHINMSIIHYTNKKSKKKTINKSTKKTMNLVKFTRGPHFSGQAQGLPAQHMVQMRYCETINLTSTVGALASYEWSANDLFDPNITGAGHQPYGFDQWCVFYNKFTVMRSQVKVEACSSGVPISFGITFARTAAPSTITTAMSLIESYRGTGTLVSGSSAPVRTVKSNFELLQTDPSFDPASFFCTSAASPTFRYHYSLFMQPTDLSSTVTLQGFVVIDYQVLLEDPLTIVQS